MSDRRHNVATPHYLSPLGRGQGEGRVLAGNVIGASF